MDRGKEAGLLWALHSFSIATTNSCPNLSRLKQHKWTTFSSAGQKSNLGCMGLMSRSLARLHSFQGALGVVPFPYSFRLLAEFGLYRYSTEVWFLYWPFFASLQKPQLLSGIYKTIDNLTQSRFPGSSFISPIRAAHPPNALPFLLHLVRRDITEVTPPSCLLSPLIISSLSLQHIFPLFGDTCLCMCITC